MTYFLHVKTLKIREYYRENGLRKTVHHFFVRLFECLVQVMEYAGFRFLRKDLIFFERRLETIEFGSLNKDSAIECGQIGKAEVEKVDNYFDGWFDKEQALKRLEEGRILFAAKMRGKFVTYFWIEPQKVVIPSLDLSFDIPEDTACIAYIFTAPEYRSKGIASKAIPYVLQGLSSMGYRHLFLLIAPRNIASQRLNKKVGFVDYQRVTCKRALFRNHLFLKYYRVRDVYSNRRKLFFWGDESAQSEIWQRFSNLRRGKMQKDLSHLRIDGSHQIRLATREVEESKLFRGLP